MKFGIKVMPREVILDAQGRVIEQTLKSENYHVEDCRMGKFIEITMPQMSEDKAYQEVKKMAEALLHNPLIETYEISRLQ